MGFTKSRPSDWVERIADAKASIPLFDCADDGTRIVLPSAWEKEWQGLPEFSIESLAPSQSIIVHFLNENDREAFAEFLQQKITAKTKSIWYPKEERQVFINTRYRTEKPVDPHYPVYIVSKGRWKSRHTSKSLEFMGVPYYIVVEQSQYDNYAAVIDSAKILVLPQKYLEDYDTYDDLGFTKSKGPGAARNFCWDHSISLGMKRHWVMDDNIQGFYRFNRNKKLKADTGAIFRAAEDFVDRYTNVAISGLQYNMFTPRKVDYFGPYTLNTRIYSCLLIDNEIPFRWQGRYNEDTDLSLRVLKAGLCTVEFYAFLQNKLPTQTVAGGCHEDFYKKEGTINKSKMLVEKHPDVARLVWKYDRWHHEVNYHPFWKNKLIRKPDILIPDSINEYGMILSKVDPEEASPFVAQKPTKTKKPKS